jgi:hypothetical protein
LHGIDRSTEKQQEKTNADDVPGIYQGNTFNQNIDKHDQQQHHTASCRD